jgi:hypothetical protein
LKNLGGILILLGMLIALPYALYVTNFSGSKIGQYPIKKGVGVSLGSSTIGGSDPLVKAIRPVKL